MPPAHVLTPEEHPWIKKVYDAKGTLLYAFKYPSGKYTMQWRAHSKLPRARELMRKHKELGDVPPPGPFNMPGHTLSADSEDNPVEAGIDDAVLAVVHEESTAPDTGSSSTATGPMLQISDSAVRGPTRPYAACSSFPCCDPTACTAPTCLRP